MFERKIDYCQPEWVYRACQTDIWMSRERFKVWATERSNFKLNVILCNLTILHNESKFQCMQGNEEERENKKMKKEKKRSYKIIYEYL